jgi:hypothetical protein
VPHGNLGARAKVCGAHLSPNQRQSLTPRCVQSPHPTLYALHKISRKPEVPYGEPYRPRPYGDSPRTLRAKRREAVRLLLCVARESKNRAKGLKVIFTQRTSAKTSGLHPGVCVVLSAFFCLRGAVWECVLLTVGFTQIGCVKQALGFLHGASPTLRGF